MYKSFLSFISRAGLAVILTACGSGSGTEGDSPTAGASSNPIIISNESASEITQEQISSLATSSVAAVKTSITSDITRQAPIAASVIGVPVRIEAENYTSMYGIQNETCTDVNAGQNVGYIETGDWMAYNDVNFNAAIEGRYKITYRVASLSGGGRLALKDLGSEITLGSIDVPRTSGWQTWVDVTQEITLTAGNHNFTITAESGGFNMNWFKLELIPDITPPSQPTAQFDAQGKIISGIAEKGSMVAVKNANNTITLGNVTANTTTGAYSLVLATALINKESVNVTATDASGNTSIAVTIVAPQIATSVVIQAENFTSMSGIQNESSTDVGGGQNVGYIETGDWLAYNTINFNVPTEARYRITYRVASLSGGGRLALKNLSDITLNSVDIPRTNGWQTWVDVTQEIRLSSGNHNFKIVAESGGFNINWFKVELLGSASSSVSSSVNPISSSSRSSSVSSSRSSVSSSRSSSLVSSSRISSVSSSSRISSISSSRISSISSSSRSSTVSSSSRSSSIAPRTVTIQWSHPSERENGVYLELYEIGGYDIRVTNPITSTTVSFGITGNSTTSYQLTNYVPEMTVEIAVYDTQGLYSQYVPINR